MLDQQIGAVMLTLKTRQRGITMMEVMVSVVIIGILMAIGAPALSNWMQNVQVRSTAESVLTGLQLARAEAVRQNTKARFQLTDTGGKASWTVTTSRLDRTDCPAGSDLFPCPVQSSGASESGQNARLGVSTASLDTTNYATAIAAGTGMSAGPYVVFDAFGRADSTLTNITRIDVTSASYANARRMIITITTSGMARLCDPSLPVSNSQSCS